MKRCARKLIVFDIDKVPLDHRSGGFKDILVILCKEKEVRDINRGYQKRKFKDILIVSKEEN